MKIEVLGSGCPSCHKLFELTQKAAKELGLMDEVAYVSDVRRIIEMGAMQVPALAIDGKIAITGATGDIGKIKGLLAGHDDSGKPEAGSGAKRHRGGNY